VKVIYRPKYENKRKKMQWACFDKNFTVYKITYKSSIIIKGENKIVIWIVGPIKIVNKWLLQRANIILVVGIVGER
jgi:hypothetical protein